MRRFCEEEALRKELPRKDKGAVAEAIVDLVRSSSSASFSGSFLLYLRVPYPQRFFYMTFQAELMDNGKLCPAEYVQN